MREVSAREESGRLAALYALDILDTEPEERFDRITRLAQRVFGTPIAMFSLIDAERQWYKSAHGIESGGENARTVSICTHAMEDGSLLIEDASLDERFADNPFVLGDPNVRFYAGHRVAAPGGEPLGTLCVIDDKPRETADFDLEALAELAAMVEAEVAALSLAIGDELTGLSNRRGFDLLGERLLSAAERLRLSLIAIYADLDNMKPINDRYGHEAGDRAIAEVGSILADTLRGSDLIARLGGDEFCALLVSAMPGDGPAAVQRVEAGLARRNATSTEPYELSLSLGVAASDPGGGTTLAELVDAADQRMLEAKREKKAGR